MSYSTFHMFAREVSPLCAAVLAPEVSVRLPAYMRAASLLLCGPGVRSHEIGTNYFLMSIVSKKMMMDKITKNQFVVLNLSVCDVGPIMLITGKTDAKTSRTDGVAMPQRKEKTAM